MLSDTTEIIRERPSETNFLCELKGIGVELILCEPSKRPVTDGTLATREQLLAHDGLHGLLHPAKRIACFDIVDGAPWPITQPRTDLQVPYSLEPPPRPGWHFWRFRAPPMGKLDFTYGDINGEPRTGGFYTIMYEPHLLAELLDSSRKSPPINFFPDFCGSQGPTRLNAPKPAWPKRARPKQKRKENSGAPLQNRKWRGSGRNHRLSSGLYASLKKRQPLGRHIRKAQLEGLPQAETDATLANKKRQRVRGIARRGQDLQENLRRRPLTDARSDCKLKAVLRALIDFGLDSGLASPKRETVAQIAKCCVTTVGRHTKTRQANGNITQAGVVVAAVHPTSGWEYRNNLWAIAANRELKMSGRALRLPAARIAPGPGNCNLSLPAPQP